MDYKKSPKLGSQTVDKLDRDRACLQSFFIAGKRGLLISVPGASGSRGGR